MAGIKLGQKTTTGDLEGEFIQTRPVNLSLQVKGKDDGKSYASVETQAEAVKGYSTVELTCQLGDNAPLWDEFNPYLYLVKST